MYVYFKHFDKMEWFNELSAIHRQVITLCTVSTGTTCYSHVYNVQGDSN